MYKSSENKIVWACLREIKKGRRKE